MFVKQFFVDAITVACYALIPFARVVENVSYLSWIILAIQVAAVFCAVSLAINWIFYRDSLRQLLRMIPERL